VTAPTGSVLDVAAAANTVGARAVMKQNAATTAVAARRARLASRVRSDGVGLGGDGTLADTPAGLDATGKEGESASRNGRTPMGARRARQPNRRGGVCRRPTAEQRIAAKITPFMAGNGLYFT